MRNVFILQCITSQVLRSKAPFTPSQPSHPPVHFSGHSLTSMVRRMSVICVLWHPPDIRSDKICWKQTYRDTFSIRPVGWMGWKWTGGRFSWDLPIEESGTLTGQSLHSERIPPCERGLKVQMTFYLLQLYSTLNCMKTPECPSDLICSIWSALH